MGILNVTPDSFSDGGVFNTADGIIARTEEFLACGVDIADIGGESTRPGSDGVDDDEEIKRVLPAVAHVSSSGIYVSVDTSKYRVAEESLKAGADMINDVCGFRDENMIKVCADYGCSVCIMHMLGEPRSMQANPEYSSLLDDVREFLYDAADRCVRAGIKESSICIDPGFGFGKTVEDNYKMLANLEFFKAEGFAVLAGMSRKSMIGAVTGGTADKRLAGSIAAHTLALVMGADIVRVHDVAESADMLKVFESFTNAGGMCLR